MGSEVDLALARVRGWCSCGGRAQVADELPAASVLLHLVVSSVLQREEDAAARGVAAFEAPRVVPLVFVQTLQLDVALFAERE